MYGQKCIKRTKRISMNEITSSYPACFVADSHFICPWTYFVTFLEVSQYLLIWDFLLSQIKIWTTTTWSNVWVVLPNPSWFNWVLDKNTRFKVFASYNILQYLCDFIYVLIIVSVSKSRKSPKLTNIVTSALHAYKWWMDLCLWIIFNP